MSIGENYKKLQNLRSFAENNIEKNIKERVIFKNYKKHLERLLYLCLKCIKMVGGDPTGRAYSTSPDPLAVMEMSR